MEAGASVQPSEDDVLVEKALEMAKIEHEKV